MFELIVYFCLLFSKPTDYWIETLGNDKFYIRETANSVLNLGIICDYKSTRLEIKSRSNHPDNEVHERLKKARKKIYKIEIDDHMGKYPIINRMPSDAPGMDEDWYNVINYYMNCANFEIIGEFYYYHTTLEGYHECSMTATKIYIHELIDLDYDLELIYHILCLMRIEPIIEIDPNDG